MYSLTDVDNLPLPCLPVLLCLYVVSFLRNSVLFHCSVCVLLHLKEPVVLYSCFSLIPFYYFLLVFFPLIHSAHLAIPQYYLNVMVLNMASIENRKKKKKFRMMPFHT